MLDFGVEGILVVENDMIRMTLAITGIDIVFSFAPDTDAYEYIRVVIVQTLQCQKLNTVLVSFLTCRSLALKNSIFLVSHYCCSDAAANKA